MDPLAIEQALETRRRRTGVVVPVYHPPGLDGDAGRALLAGTVRLLIEEVDDPAAICLSVDGEAHGGDAARELAASAGVSVCVSPENGGKLRAAGAGARRLLERPGLRYAVVVDQDGDHFPNELLNFVRAAEHIRAGTGDDRILVLGRRLSRHRPMGFLRGELEELADRVLLDALAYHAAVTGRPLRLEYAALFDEAPDFHSGYKLFSARAAEDVFVKAEPPAGVSDSCHFRHACEAVMCVEALANGARFGVVNRTTLNGQPVSTFGLYDRAQMVADKMIWPCRRLGVPAAFADQWMANHVPRLLLNTLAPAGREELGQIRRLVMAGLGAGADEPRGERGMPLFV